MISQNKYGYLIEKQLAAPYEFFVTLCCILILIGFICINTGYSQETQPLTARAALQNNFIEAEKIGYNLNCDILTAEGKVKVWYGNYLLSSPKLLYNRQDNILLAPKGGFLYDKYGNTFLFDKIIINRYNSQAIALGARAKLPKSILLAANSAIIYEDKALVLNRAVFSSCRICASNYVPNIPLWQIKAEEMQLDNINKRMSYKHAYLELFGKKVLYIPYIILPAPYAKRQSGLLAPILQSSSDIGLQLRMPYYLNIASNMDLVLAPILSSKKSIIYDIEFRHLTKHGLYHINGSITHLIKSQETNTKTTQRIGRSLKGHIDAAGVFSYNELQWPIEYGFNIKKIIDKEKTYLKKYDINDDDILISKLYINSRVNHYLEMALLSFQDLRPQVDPEKVPETIPFLRYQNNNIFDTNRLKLSLSTIAYSIKRNIGASYNKLILEGKVNLPFITNNGQVVNLAVGARSDLYHNIIISPIQRNTYNKTGYSKTYPFWDYRWQWPLYGKILNNIIIIQPIITIQSIFAHDPKDKFISEESNVMELGISNIFNLNRFLDTEQIENGIKFSYGLRSSLYTAKVPHYLGFFIGYTGYNNFGRKISTNTYTASKHEYVTQLAVQLSNNIFIIDRTWFSKKKLLLMKHEINVLFNMSYAQLELGYAFNRREPGSFNDITGYHQQETSVFVNYNIYKEWWVNMYVSGKIGPEVRRNNNAKDKTHIMKGGIGITYKGDCVHVHFSVNRNNIRLKDIKPSTSYTAKISLPMLN